MTPLPALLPDPAPWPPRDTGPRVWTPPDARWTPWRRLEPGVRDALRARAPDPAGDLEGERWGT